MFANFVRLLVILVVLGTTTLWCAPSFSQDKECDSHKNIIAAGRTFYALEQAIERHIQATGTPPAGLEELDRNTIVDSDGRLVGIETTQYRYEFRYQRTPTGWSLRATPLETQEGCGSFFVDETGVMRWRRKPGEVSSEDDAFPMRLRVGGNVQKARLIKEVPPEYPEEARRKRTKGIVDLFVILNRQGKVASIEVLKGNPILVGAAVAAVKQWEYQATFLNGIPVEIATRIEVVFQ